MGVRGTGTGVGGGGCAARISALITMAMVVVTALPARAEAQTVVGAELLKDINPGSGNGFPKNFVEFENRLYFNATPDEGTDRIYRTDGSEGGTELFNSPGGHRMTPVGSTLFFQPETGGNNRRIWKTDGTVGGTGEVLELPHDPPDDFSYEPNGFAAGVGKLLFRYNDGSNGSALWQSDGSAGGTTLLKDTIPGPGGSGPSLNITAFGDDRALFSSGYKATSDGFDQTELWITDGTTGGTTLLKDVRAGEGSSFPGGFTEAGSTMFFTANDNPAFGGFPNDELWRTDGTSAGTVKVKEINPGADSSSYPQLLTAVGGKLYFVADNGSNGRELWVSDGSAAGTTMVADINPGSASSDPRNLVEIDGSLYFAATEPGTGEEPWVVGADGAAKRLADIEPGPAGSLPAYFAGVGDDVVFSATEASSGTEVWRTDGAETELAADIIPGPGSSRARRFTPIGDDLVFAAATPDNGQELLKVVLDDCDPDCDIIVNDIGDDADDSNGGPCDTDDSTSERECTLRAAIETAEAKAGDDSITFDLDAGFTIAPATPFDELTETVTIDGTNANRDFTIDGSSAGAAADGLVLSDDDNKVSNLTIEGFGGTGIVFSGGDSVLTGSTIGDPTATNPNGVGVRLSGDRNTVGPPVPGPDEPILPGNTIAGNGDPAGLLAAQSAGTSTAASHTGDFGAGIIVDGGSIATVSQNIIGLPTDAGLNPSDAGGGPGRALAGGNSVGVAITGGGDLYLDGNRLIGNNTAVFNDAGGSGLQALDNTFSHNWAGITAAGNGEQLEIGDVGDDVSNSFTANGIGVELLPGDGATVENNTFTANTSFGILAAETDTADFGGVAAPNEIEGGPFGLAMLGGGLTSIDGLDSSGSEGAGLLLEGTRDVTVGAEAENSIEDGLAGVIDLDTRRTKIVDSDLRGNDWGIYSYLGVDTEIGSEAKPNTIASNDTGIELLVAHAPEVQTYIDGFRADSDTTFAVQRLASISDIARHLELLAGEGSPTNSAGSNAEISNNLIGTDSEDAVLGNDAAIRIGHDVADSGIVENTVANTTRTGIQIGGPKPDGAADPIGIEIRDNELYDNGTAAGDPPTTAGLGIDLYSGGLGLTRNDPANPEIPAPPDADDGANELQNFPVLASAKLRPGGLVDFKGSLESTPSASYRIDVYGVEACHPSGYGEGATPLGSVTVDANSDGTAKIERSLTRTSPDLDFMAVTATDTFGNTSEFSRCIEITGGQIEGVIGYPDGTAIEGIKVKLTGGDLPPEGAVATTNGAGAYVFEDLPEGDYTVTPQEPDGRWWAGRGEGDCENPDDSLVSCTITELSGTVVADVQTTCGGAFQNLQAGKPLADSAPGTVSEVQKREGTSVISFGSMEAYGCFYHRDDGTFISDENTPFRLNGFDLSATQTIFDPSSNAVTTVSDANVASPQTLSLKGQPIGPFPLNQSFPPGKQQINYPSALLSWFGIPSLGIKTEAEKGSTKIEFTPKIPESGTFDPAQKGLEDFVNQLNSKETISSEGAVVVKTSNKDGASFDGIKFEIKRDMKVTKGPRLKRVAFEYSESELQWKLLAEGVVPGGLALEMSLFWAYPKASASAPIYDRTGYLAGGQAKLKNINKGPIGSTGVYFQDVGFALKVHETKREFTEFKGLMGASFLPRLEGGLFVSPTKTWTGGIESRTPQLPGFLDKLGVTKVSRIIDLQAEAAVTFPETTIDERLTTKSGKIALKGTATLFKGHPYAEIPLASLNASLEAPYVDPETIGGGVDLLRSKFDFTGQVGYTAPFGVFSVNGLLGGWATGNPEPYFQGEGNVNATVFGAGGNYKAVINPRAFAICGTLSAGGASVSSGVAWREYELAFGAFAPLDSCDFVSISKPKPFAAPAEIPAGRSGGESEDGAAELGTAITAARAQTSATKLKLPKKTDGAGFAFVGKKAPPKLTLKAKGLKLTATKPGKSKSQMVMMDPNTNTTYVFIANPPGGKVKVTPLKGSEIKTVEQAKALPDPKPKATVEPIGGCNTQLIDFSQANSKGQSTTLYEVGPSSRTEMGRTSKPEAKLRFQPAAAAEAETREIRAIVSQNDVPRGEEETIATFQIGANGTLLGAPLKLKAKRKKDKLTAKWKGGCGAVGYKVVVKKGKKTVKKAATTKTKLKLKKLPRKGKLKVFVSSVADDGSVSDAVGVKAR